MTQRRYYEGSSVRRRIMTMSSALILTALVAVGMVSSATARTHQTKKVSVRLDFLIRGHHSGFYVALDKGWYRDAGLDVSISEGTGSTATAQLVASGRETFGFVDASAQVAANTQGAGLKMVANMRGKNGLAIVVRKDSSITRVKDLEGGPRVAVTPPGTYIFNTTPLYLKAAGVDPDKVKLVSISNFQFLTAFLTKQVDAVVGLVDGEVTQIQLAGVPVRLFPFEEKGFDPLSHGIVTKASTIAQDRETVRKFVQTTVRGWRFMLDNPRVAVGILQKYYPNIDPTQYVARINGVKKVITTPNNAGFPLGWMSRKDWGRTAFLLSKYGGLANIPGGLNNLYTNEFIPPCKSKRKPTKTFCR